MWYVGNYAFNNAFLSGGVYTEATTRSQLWSCIYINQNGNFNYRSSFNHFEKMLIYYADAAINVKLDNSSWVNSNWFTDIIAHSCRSTLRTRVNRSNSAYFDANTLTLTTQAGSNTRIGIDTLSGYNNHIIHYAWDFINGVTGASTGVLGTQSYKNDIIESGDRNQNFSDLGRQNTVFAHGKYLSYFTDSLVIGMNKVNHNVNQITLLDNITGSPTVPAGSVGIKMGLTQSIINFDGTADNTARVISKNSGGTDYGSFLYLQTHGTASNATTYVDALTLVPSGNATVYGATNYVLDNSVGGNDTYTATVIESFGYIVGRVIIFHPLTLNTGACTLAINGGTAYGIKTQANGDPANSDMVATGYYPLCWNGSNWVLMTK